MAGLSTTGFSVKRLTDIISSLKASANTEFSGFLTSGDVLDTTDNSVLGRWIKIIAEPLAELWETSQQVYSSFDINQATGVSLEELCALGGVIRNTATASQALLVSYGTYGVTIPDGSYVRSANTNKVFEFQEAVTLNETGATAIQITPTVVADSTAYSFTYKVLGSNLNPVTVTYTSGVSATTSSIVNGLMAVVNASHSTYIEATLVGADLLVQVTNQDYACDFVATQFMINKAKKQTLATCTETGVNLQDANTVETIQSPLVGWDTVTNPFAAIAGKVVETDAELRLRFLQAKFQDGSNTYEAIYASVLKLDGVKQIVIYENETDTAFVSPPVPAHSFYPIVLGGISTEIAKAIWDNKPAGILSYGTVTTGVADSQGILHDISFDRPTDLPIYISLTISVDSTFPTDGEDLIRASLVEYLSGHGIGEDVLYSRLYTPINSATGGFYVTSLNIGTSASPVGTSNISVDYNEIVNISASNILVSFV